MTQPNRQLFYCFIPESVPQHSRSDGSGEETGLIGRFVGQYPKKQTSRAYRTDLQKFEAFLDENRGSATLEDASRRDVLRFLRAQSQSVGRSTVRRRATALKSFFAWLEGQGHRDDRPIKEDENVSSLVDAVFEKDPEEDPKKDPPAEENRVPAEQGRPGRPEGPTTEKKPTSDDEPSSAEKPSSTEEPTEVEEPTEEEPTGREDPAAGAPSPGKAENTDPEEEADPDEKKSISGEQTSQDEKTHRQDERVPEDERAPEDKEPLEDEKSSQRDTYSPEGPLDIPHWVYDAAEETADHPPLRAAPHIPLVEVPGALRHGLGELSEWTDSWVGPDYIRITCEGGDLVVNIQFRKDSSRAERARIEAQIEHRLLERIVERGPDSLRSRDTVPEQALRYFWGRSWRMPPEVYELIDLSHTGGRPEKRPTWTSTAPDSTQARYQTAVEVTGALTKAFGLEKDEKVLVSLGP